MTWNEWAERHAALFGMHSEGEVKMLRAWAGHFQGEGYSPAEMAAATDRVASMPDPPRYRADQLPVLQRMARDARAGRFERKAPEPARAECKLCGGDGMFGVPDYAGMARYEALWHRSPPWKTQTVHCRCPLGLWKSQQPKRALQSLAEYEQTNEGRDWRRDLEQHRLEQESLRAALGEAGALDRTLGKLLRKLRTDDGRAGTQAAPRRVADAGRRGDDAGDG